MENEKDDKKKKTLLLILSIATMLVTIAGATFAFFTITVAGNNSSSSVIIKTATIGISYNGGNEVKAEYIKPGDVIPTKTFTINNTGNSSISYNLKWINVTNDFAVPADLKYKLTGTTTSGGGNPVTINTTQAPTTNGNIATSININTNATHTYVLEMSFPNTGAPQDENQGKTFMAKIEVEVQ